MEEQYSVPSEDRSWEQVDSYRGVIREGERVEFCHRLVHRYD